MMGKGFTSHMKALKLREVKQRAFQFKSIQAQYGLTTGLHTRAESFCARQRHTALGKEVIIIIFFSYIFSLTVYYIKCQEYWMLCFKYSPDCRAMNYLMLLVQKPYLTVFFFLNGIILISISQHYFELS